MSLSDLNKKYQTEIRMHADLKKKFNEIYVMLVSKKY